MKDRFVRFMRRLGWMPVPVVSRRARMSQEQLMVALASPGPGWDAVQVLIQESIDQINTTAQQPQIAADHGMLAYYTGGAAHVENLRDALELMRAKAQKASEA